jgi:aminopeptidase YwaD
MSEVESGLEGRALLAVKAGAYLNALCRERAGRRVGTAANREATDFAAGTFARLGLSTESPAFDCIDWWQDGAELVADAERFFALVSPFSLGASARAPLAVASTVDDLEAHDLSGRVLLLRGEVAKEQLMPKGFAFYNPDEHKRIIRALETAGPAAIIAATGRDPGMAGAVYPFPLIEDGDFDIPSAYITDVEGERLARKAGHEAIT